MWENGHRWYVHKSTWLCSHKTLFYENRSYVGLDPWAGIWWLPQFHVGKAVLSTTMFQCLAKWQVPDAECKKYLKFEWSFLHYFFSGKSRSAWPPVWVISVDAGTKHPCSRLLFDFIGHESGRGTRRICPLFTAINWSYRRSKYTPVFLKYIYVYYSIYRNLIKDAHITP